MTTYFQDQIPHNHCFGCGPNNSLGLRIKSYWADDGSALCDFHPAPHHCAAPTNFLNGGIIATLIDCHAICTAMAHAHKKAGRELGQGETIWYVTASLSIKYLRPSAMDTKVQLEARIAEEAEKTIDLECTLTADGKTCAVAEVTAAQVPASWMNSR